MINIEYILQNHGVGGGSKSKDKIPPPQVTDFGATLITGKGIKLSWKNPKDSDFFGVKILRKGDDYPQTVNDGTLVYSGANESYEDINLQADTEYFYSIFSYDYDNNYSSLTDGTKTKAIYRNVDIYGFDIDMSEPDSKKCVTYTANNADVAPALRDDGVFDWNGWQDRFIFNDINPCLFTDGAVNYYLNKDDYTKKRDGTKSVLTGTDGDVMVEFPKFYMKIEKQGTVTKVRMSKEKVDDSYKCLAHMTPEGTEVDKLYIGAYLCEANYKSVVTTSLKKFNTKNYATVKQTRGERYDIMCFHQLTMIQALFILLFKDLDSQCGQKWVGQVGGGNTTSGSTKDCPFFYGSSDKTDDVKIFGIERMWGDYTTAIGGIATDSDMGLFIGNTFTGNDMTKLTKTSTTVKDTSLSSGTSPERATDIAGTTEFGFLPINSMKDSYDVAGLKNFCDFFVVTSSRTMTLGYPNETYPQFMGLFSMSLDLPLTSNYVHYWRLMYR